MKNLLSQVLVTGGAGMIGSYIDFGIKTDRRSLDVANFNGILTVFRKYRPSVVIHLAAETDVEICENDPLRAYSINIVGTYNVARAAKIIGAKLIYISTNDVFDGFKGSPYTEDDEPNPQNVYGLSKYIGELVVRGLGGDYLIVRTSWVFGGGPERDKKFVAKIINQLKDANIKEIKVVSDIYGTITFGKDLVAALKEAILNGASGVLHLTNSGVVSRYDVTQEIMKITRSRKKIVPVGANAFPGDVRLGSNYGLVSKKTKLRPWQEALKEYLETEWKNVQVK